MSFEKRHALESFAIACSRILGAGIPLARAIKMVCSKCGKLNKCHSKGKCPDPFAGEKWEDYDQQGRPIPISVTANKPEGV